MSRVKLQSIVCVVAMGLLYAASCPADTYDFEGLALADLVGQDNWTGDVGETAVGTGTGYNTTKTVANSVTSGSCTLTRTNDASFSFPAFEDDSTHAVMEFDAKFVYGAKGGINFWVGSSSGESPKFGFAGIGPNPPGFYIREAGNGAEHGATVSGIDADDWLRLQLVMNFTANTGTFFYKNLTDGDVSFTQVASLTDIPLNITSSPSGWDEMKVYFAPGGLAAGVMQIDNLVLKVVPPPANTYHFEGLALADLVGQDNWTGDVGETAVGTGTGYNTTKTVANSVTSGSCTLTRTNDASFSFPAFEDDSTHAVMEFDAKFVYGAKGGINFWVGSSSGESPKFGFAGIGPNPPGFYIREAGNGAEHGATVSGIDADDWLRLQLVMNFTANTGTFFYKNLTDGDVSFTQVASLTDIPLNITSSPSGWDEMKVYFAPGGLAAGVMQIDNLVPRVVPPAGTMVLIR